MHQQHHDVAAKENKFKTKKKAFPLTLINTFFHVSAVVKP